MTEDLKLVSLMMQYSDNNKLITHNTMIKNLTTLNWRKSIYYTSDNVIFEISDKKIDDFDNCGTYLIDLENAPEAIQNAKDGAILDLTFDPSIFSRNVPYIEIVFSDPTMTKVYPLQYLIEEGDKIIDNAAVQYHPRIYNGSYIDKFIYDIYYYIGSLFNPKKFNMGTIMKSLPGWLTTTDHVRMTKRYAESSFMKGEPYDEEKATKLAYENEEMVTFDHIALHNGETNVILNSFTQEVVMDIITAIYAEDTVSAYRKTIDSGLSDKYLTSAYLVSLGNSLYNTIATGTKPNGSLRMLPQITIEGEALKLSFDANFVSNQ